MITSNKIIGIAGTFGSGKDTLANYLIEKKHYYHVSTGDLVRKESLKRHNSIERSPYLQETAEYLRRTFGGGVLVHKAFEEFQEHSLKNPGIVITGIRSLGEAKAIQSIGGVLVYVDAPIEERFMRVQSRKRDNEAHITFEEFKAIEQKEATNSNDDASFNIYRIKDIADFILQNNRDEQSFFDSAIGALKI